MKIILIYNPKSGTARNFADGYHEKICELIRHHTNGKYDIVAISILENNLDQLTIAENSEEIKAIIVSGGDGTISSSLKLVVQNNVPLGIIPMGTFNNFAGDNNIPADVSEAIKVISEFKTTDIDIGEINGLYFMNNSSIGLYTKSVKIRERTRKEYKLSKFTAMSLAMIRMLYFFPLLKVELKIKDKTERIKTPFVFIGNNKYRFDLLSLGEREELNKGKLFVYFSKCKYRFCLIKIAINALLGKLGGEEELISVAENELTIQSKKKNIHVAADGEIYKLRSPLNYKIHPKAVKLITAE